MWTGLNARQLKPKKQLQMNEEFRCTGPPGPYFVDVQPLTPEVTSESTGYDEDPPKWEGEQKQLSQPLRRMKSPQKNTVSV